MRVLITGSSGQIGTNLGLALMERGDEVVGIDRRTNAWTDKIKTVQMDLLKAAPEDFPQGRFDVVVHLAAHAKVFELVETPTRALENVTSCFSALEYARRHKCPFIFGSSREVYGDIVRHVTEEAEADFVVAESPYSASKIAGEAFIYSYAECYGLPYLVFRFSNVYGRYDNDIKRMERVLPLFVSKIARDEPIIVFGKEKVFDFTYVDDCINGICRGIDAPGLGQSAQPDGQRRLRPGQHARRCGQYHCPGAEQVAQGRLRAGPRGRGHALRGRHQQGPTTARVRPADATYRRHSQEHTLGEGTRGPLKLEGWYETKE